MWQRIKMLNGKNCGRMSTLNGYADLQMHRAERFILEKKDDGTVIGLQDSKKLLEDIPNKVRDVLGIIVDVPSSFFPI